MARGGGPGHLGLAAGLGWHLTRCKVAFDAGVKLPETELDFVLRSEAGNCLIECKMNHLLDHDKLRATLYQNRNQLRDHLLLAKAQAMSMSHVACVVNLTREQLAPLSRTMEPETDAEFVRAGGQLLSYEDFPSWLMQTFPDSRR